VKGQTRLSGPVFLKGEDIAIPPSFQLQREKKSNCKAHRDCEKKVLMFISTALELSLLASFTRYLITKLQDNNNKTKVKKFTDA
jgi:hypothetical protein